MSDEPAQRAMKEAKYTMQLVEVPVAEAQSEVPEPAAAPSGGGAPKRRGRPPTKNTKPAKPKPSTKKEGIVVTPSHAEHTMELLHDDPDLFKSIFTLFHKYGSPHLSIAFYPTYVRFFSASHNEQATIIVDVRGEDISHYYCKAFMQVNIDDQQIAVAMGAIRSGHSQFVMLMGDPKLDPKLVVVLTYYKSKRTDQITLYPMGQVKDQVGIDLTDADYPIKFALDTSEFKELLTDISSISNTLTIQKTGNDPLSISTKCENKIARLSSYVDEKEIGLVSTVLPTQTFQSSISIENVKPLIASNIGEVISVSAHIEKGIIFRTQSSTICNVSVAINVLKAQ